MSDKAKFLNLICPQINQPMGAAKYIVTVSYKYFTTSNRFKVAEIGFFFYVYKKDAEEGIET